MRWSASLLLGAAAVVLATTPPAMAEIDPLSTEVAPPRTSLASAIVANLEKRSSVASDATERAWLSELTGYYRAPGAEPLWVDGAGLTDRARSVIAEIARADDYGLDAARFVLPEAGTLRSDPEALAAAEVTLSFAAVRYTWHAVGGRVDPSKLSLWLDQSPRTLYASTVVAELAGAGDPAARLRAYHPQHPQFERLRQAYLEARGGGQATSASRLPPGPRLVKGDRHPDVVAIRRLLDQPAEEAEDEDLLDGDLIAALRQRLRDEGYGRLRAVDDEVREALSRPTARGGSRQATLDKFIVNMERWRWLPRDLGALHVWNNLPEFVTRVVKDGEIIHQERIVVGTEKTQTPVFSDRMSHVIFHPEWGVPESIKIRSLLPHLRGGDYGVLARRNMRIVADGKEIRPSRFNWSKVSMRDVPIVQGAGDDNPLGQLKFIFPNGHDVYMHDTPSKSLFETSARAHSHGCIRVRNPERFAEVILGQVQGWTASDVKRQLARPETTQVDLKSEVPVHNTYLTLVVDAAGKLNSFADIYGHDRRILDALKGTPVKEIAARDPALALRRENQELAKAAAYYAPRPAVPPPPQPFLAFSKPLPPASLGRKGQPKPPPKFIFRWN